MRWFWRQLRPVLEAAWRLLAHPVQSCRGLGRDIRAAAGDVRYARERRRYLR